jgi:hypothetical protein
MNKSKFITLAMLALLLTFVLVLAGCGENTDPKKITITGLNDERGNELTITIYDLDAIREEVAEGRVQIFNNSATVPLYKDRVEWTGTGSYIVSMVITGNGPNKWYVYTNGKTWEEVGLSSKLGEDFGKGPKYDITRATSTIALSKFRQQDE